MRALSPKFQTSLPCPEHHGIIAASKITRCALETRDRIGQTAPDGSPCVSAHGLFEQFGSILRRKIYYFLHECCLRTASSLSAGVVRVATGIPTSLKNSSCPDGEQVQSILTGFEEELWN
jgi:hypothetical protein